MMRQHDLGWTRSYSDLKRIIKHSGPWCWYLQQHAEQFPRLRLKCSYIRCRDACLSVDAVMPQGGNGGTCWHAADQPDVSGGRKYPM